MKRILIYSHDTYGLGNIRRMLGIAEAIKRDFRDVSILLLSGSPMIHAFRLGEDMDYVKLPCLSRDEADSYTPKSLSISKGSILKLRSDLIQSTVLNFEPDLILVDKKPLGVGNELAPMLGTLGHLDKKPKLILVLRDILDKPETTIPVWAKNGYHDVIRSVYDRILVLGSSDVFNAVEEYAFPPSSAEKTFFCGYTKRADFVRSPLDVRKELGINGGRLVLVTTGGGEDGARLVREALNTARNFGRRFADHCVIFLGPEMPPNEAERFKAWSSLIPDVTVKSFSNDIVSYVGAADAVVSMGGYNTVTEILSMAVPAVIVPRTKPVSEQQIRATKLESLGLVKAIDPGALSPRVLFRAVTEAIEQHQSAITSANRLDFTALKNIVGHVGQLLDFPVPAHTQLTSDFPRLEGRARSRTLNGPDKTIGGDVVPLAVGNI